MTDIRPSFGADKTNDIIKATGATLQYGSYMLAFLYSRPNSHTTTVATASAARNETAYA
jgi:hypothetical protein